MKKTAFLCLITGLSLAACNQPAEKTEEQPVEAVAPAVAEEPAPMPDSATAAKMWMDYMSPGDMHAMLAKQAGDWKTQMTFWEYPGAEPTTTTGLCTFKMGLGGRYLQASYEATMMGMPFEGNGVTGYDNAKKKFVATWTDNMGTGIMVAEGDYDAANNQTVLVGTTPDIMTGKTKQFKEVHKVIDDNNMVLRCMTLTPMAQSSSLWRLSTHAHNHSLIIPNSKSRMRNAFGSCIYAITLYTTNIIRVSF